MYYFVFFWPKTKSKCLHITRHFICSVLPTSIIVRRHSRHIFVLEEQCPVQHSKNVKVMNQYMEKYRRNLQFKQQPDSCEPAKFMLSKCLRQNFILCKALSTRMITLGVENPWCLRVLQFRESRTQVVFNYTKLKSLHIDANRFFSLVYKKSNSSVMHQKNSFEMRTER